MNELEQLKADLSWIIKEYLKALETIDILTEMVERAERN